VAGAGISTGGRGWTDPVADATIQDGRAGLDGWSYTLNF
jgi:hypothetical protein